MGLGLGFGLENKENQKCISGTAKPLMANLDIGPIVGEPHISTCVHVDVLVGLYCKTHVNMYMYVGVQPTVWP